jgi:hypothetical protein
MTAVGGDDTATASARTEAGRAHETSDAFAADGDATSPQCTTQARPAIRLSTIRVHEPQLRDQPRIISDPV